jgi:phosphatidylglycerol:prolipoprotein diacylglycerol transferase
MLLAIPFPAIDPVLIEIGPVVIRWYALAYIAGLVGGWLVAREVARRDSLWGALPRPKPESLDDLLVYVAFGVILGGRLGYVLFYNLDFFVDNPGRVFAVWEGGMAFHGGLAGAAVGICLFARRYRVSAFTVADICALGRVPLASPDPPRYCRHRRAARARSACARSPHRHAIDQGRPER